MQERKASKGGEGVGGLLRVLLGLKEEPHRPGSSLGPGVLRSCSQVGVNRFGDLYIWGAPLMNVMGVADPCQRRLFSGSFFLLVLKKASKAKSCYYTHAHTESVLVIC